MSAEPLTLAGESRDYQRIATALEWLAENFSRQPRLAEVARQVHLSEFHFQRLFTRWAGISPKRYVQLLTLEDAKAALAASRSTLDAALDAGFSGPSRLHDAIASVDALTPAEYRRAGEGMTLRYGFAPSPFGEALLISSERGLCGLAFVDGEGRESTLVDQRARLLPRATYVEDAASALALGQTIFNGGPGDSVSLLLCGTAFQVQVWRALLRLGPGDLVSYGQLASMVGKPKAARAAGSATGRNLIAWLVPCHRVIRDGGALGGYHWGLGRKLALLNHERLNTTSGQYASAVSTT